jgi:hypothetical protein
MLYNKPMPLQILSTNTRRTKVVELTTGTHRWGFHLFFKSVNPVCKLTSPPAQVTLVPLWLTQFCGATSASV